MDVQTESSYCSIVLLKALNVISVNTIFNQVVERVLLKETGEFRVSPADVRKLCVLLAEWTSHSITVEGLSL